MELLLSKIPRHYRRDETKKKNYITNIHKYFNQKKNNNNNYWKKYLSKSRLFQHKDKNSPIMPPNYYNSEFVKKIVEKFYN